MKALLLGAGAALALAGAAAAQDQSPPPKSQSMSEPAAADAAKPDSVAATALKPGMAVVDKSGAPVGTISRVVQLPDGRAAAAVTIDGKEIGVLASSLSVSASGDQAVSAHTKAEILASPG